MGGVYDGLPIWKGYYSIEFESYNEWWIIIRYWALHCYCFPTVAMFTTYTMSIGVFCIYFLMKMDIRLYD